MSVAPHNNRTLTVGLREHKWLPTLPAHEMTYYLLPEPADMRAACITKSVLW